jgi:hypothetical protein
MATLKLRGRAASKVRVGHVIKGVLSGKIPDEQGRLVTEAAIVDVHHVYKQLVRAQNDTRHKKLKPMVYSSFVCQFRFAEKLGLVHLIRKEPLLFPPSNGHLYTFRVHDGNIGEISQRHIYSLTPVGLADELSWTNLTQAYIQHWVAPQSAPEYEIAAKVYTFKKIPSIIAFTELKTYLQAMTATAKELFNLSYSVGDWATYFSDRSKVSKIADYNKLSDIIDNQLSVALENNKPKEAIEVLNNMIAILGRIHEKGSRMTEEQATEEPETATIQSKLHGLMDSDNKAKSIKALRSALEQLDEDKFEGISDVTDAIDEYDDIGRAGLSAEEYADDKQTAFDEIDEAIDGITETEEE